MKGSTLLIVLFFGVSSVLADTCTPSAFEEDAWNGDVTFPDWATCTYDFGPNDASPGQAICDEPDIRGTTFFDDFRITSTTGLWISKFHFLVYQEDATVCDGENILKATVDVYDHNSGYPLDPDSRHYAHCDVFETRGSKSPAWVEYDGVTDERPIVEVIVSCPGWTDGEEVNGFYLGAGDYTVGVSIEGVPFLNEVGIVQAARSLYHAFSKEDEELVADLAMAVNGVPFDFQDMYGAEAGTYLRGELDPSCWQASVAVIVGDRTFDERIACTSPSWSGVKVYDWMANGRWESANAERAPAPAPNPSYQYSVRFSGPSGEHQQDRWPTVTEDYLLGCTDDTLTAWVRGVDEGEFRATHVMAGFRNSAPNSFAVSAHYQITGQVSMAFSCVWDAYMLVWSAIDEPGDTSNIYGRLVHSNGEMGPVRRFTHWKNAGKSAAFPRVVYNRVDKVFVVVWEQTSPEERNNVMEIYGNVVRVSEGRMDDQPNRQMSDHIAVDQELKPFHKETLYPDVVHLSKAGLYALSYLGDGLVNNGFQSYSQLFTPTLRRLRAELQHSDLDQVDNSAFEPEVKRDVIMARMGATDTRFYSLFGLEARTGQTSLVPANNCGYLTISQATVDIRDAATSASQSSFDDLNNYDDTVRDDIDNDSYLSVNARAMGNFFFIVSSRDRAGVRNVVHFFTFPEDPFGDNSDEPFGDGQTFDKVWPSVVFSFPNYDGLAEDLDPFRPSRNGLAECDGWVPRGEATTMDITPRVSIFNEPPLVWTIKVELECQGTKYAPAEAVESQYFTDNTGDFCAGSSWEGNLRLIELVNMNLCPRGLTRVQVFAKAVVDGEGSQVFPKASVNDQEAVDTEGMALIGECSISQMRDTPRARDEPTP